MLSEYSNPGWTLFDRDDKNGFMNYITNLVKAKFGIAKKDAWNPADIWLIKSTGGMVPSEFRQQINEAMNGDKGGATQTLEELNVIMRSMFNKNQLVGVVVIQRVQLYLKDMFRHEGATRFKEALQNTLSKFLKGNILVVGNLTHTGQHGLFVDQTKISQTQFIEKIFEACEELTKWIRIERKRKIRLILFKDYFKNDSIHLEQSGFESKNFYKMQVQPNMIMKPRKNWLSTQDYVADMTTKYRSRFNRARQKRESIITKELNIEEIKNHSLDLYKLYKNVSKNASFNTFILPKNHFLILKEHLLDDFKVFAYDRTGHGRTANQKGSFHFNFQTKEDFIYHILFTFEQLKLEVEEVKLYFTGAIELESEIYTITYQYIRNIFFLESNNSIFSKLDASKHSNYTLFNS